MQKRQKGSKSKDVPKHIAIIPDGNRRWARSHGFMLMEGYKLGVKRAIDVSTWAKEFGVNTLTIWALSTENIKNRSRLELSVLYKVYEKAAKDPNILNMLKNNKACIKIVGNLDLLPKFLLKALRELESKTNKYKEFSINLLVGYGGKDEIVYALNKVYNMALKGQKLSVNEDLINSSIYSNSVTDPDLIIRTSGEMRLSGLLPWQSSYSELYFENKNWPDFGKEDLKRAIDTFSNRHRRFGK